MTTIASAPSRTLWMLWAGLCALTILNANSIAVLAGAPERLFNPLLLLTALGVVGPLVGELRRINQPPIPAALVFAAVFLLVGGFAATTGTTVPIEQAVARIPLHLAAVLLLLAGICMAARAHDSGETTRMLLLMFWPFVLASVSGVLFVTVPRVGDFLALLPGERLHGVFGNINELGGQAGYSLVVGLALTMRTKQRRWLVIGAVAGAIGVVSSFSKAAMLGFLPLIALVGYALSGARPSWRPLLMLAGASLVTAVGVVWLSSLLLDGGLGIELSTDQRARLTALMEIVRSGALDETATTGRWQVWQMGIQNWSSSPIIGLGLSAFDRVIGIDMEIHNTALRVLGESGLLGMIAFMVMVFSLTAAVVRDRRRDVHVLGLGFLLVQLPVVMSTGGILLARNHNLISGVVIGLLAAGVVDAPPAPVPSPAAKAPMSPSPG